jgi:hypothetical protein
MNEIMTPLFDGPSAMNDSGNSESICPATSSTTTLPGSFNRRIRSVRDAAQIPAHVIATIATSCSGNDPSSTKRATPTSDPHVPGATGKYPTPHVDIASAT